MKTPIISQSGKKTNLFFQRDSTEKAEYHEILNSEIKKIESNQEILHYLNTKNTLINKKHKMDSSFFFMNETRSKVLNRINSNSPRNKKEQNYNISYKLIQPKTPFLAKLDNIKKSPKKTISQRNFLGQENGDLKKETSEKEETGGRIPRFSKILPRPPDVFPIKHEYANLNYEININEKNKTLNFKDYLDRTEIFVKKNLNQNEYENSFLIKEKLTFNKTPNLPIRWQKNDEKTNITDYKAVLEHEITDKTLYAAYNQTHMVLNDKTRKFERMLGRESLSPNQNRILKANEKIDKKANLKINEETEKAKNKIKKILVDLDKIKRTDVQKKRLNVNFDGGDEIINRSL